MVVKTNTTHTHKKNKITHKTPALLEENPKDEDVTWSSELPAAINSDGRASVIQQAV